MNSDRICGTAIEHYCFSRDRDLELTFEEKRNIVAERAKHLDKTEWQRWVPIVGLVRFFKDMANNDELILNEIRSTGYNMINGAYNLASGIALGAFGISYLLK